MDLHKVYMYLYPSEIQHGHHYWDKKNYVLKISEYSSSRWTIKTILYWNVVHYKWFHGEFYLFEIADLKTQYNCYWIVMPVLKRSSHSRDHMVVGFTTTCAISAYHH
jgi:hypothetical protein